MAIEMMSDRDNDVKAVFETAYLKLLDVEVCASSGNVRLPYYLYADREARNAEHPLQVKQGVEMVTAEDFAGAFLAELDVIRSDKTDLRSDAEKVREAQYKAGYAVLKSRGFQGEDC